MQLSSLEHNIFDDLVQDSHELWEWYVFVRYDRPELPDDDVVRSGRDLIFSWVNRGWLQAFKSRTHNDTVTANELKAAVDQLGSNATDPREGTILLTLSPRALKDIGKLPTFSEGKRYVNPGVPGEVVRTQSGFSTASDPIRRGPYAKISKAGRASYVPLAGNPTLSH